MTTQLRIDTAYRLASWLALGTPAALLAGAYISQYVFGLQPCEMCWWQRYAHFIALAIATVALFLPSRAIVALAALALISAAAIGGFHAGVEYGWWEGLTRCASNASGGNALDDVLNAPLIRCDVAPWSLFGISLAGWNFLISGAAALAILLLLFRGNDHD